MIWQAFRATFRAIASDRPALTLLILSTILYSFFYPSAYRGETATRIPVAIIDLDGSATSRSVTGKIAAIQQANVVAHLTSVSEAQSLLEKGFINAFILIPEDFGEDIQRGAQGEVALYGNGAYLLKSNTSLNGIASALRAVGIEAATDQARILGAPAAQPLTAVVIPLFNAHEGYGSTVVPGVVFIIIHQTLLMGLAMLAATVREKQGWVRLEARSFLGVVLAFFTLGMIEIIYFTGFVFWFQDYPRGAASILALAVAGTLFILATVTGALALASFFRTRERPLQIWILTSLPIYFLSGLSWPTEAMPEWLTMLARLLPTTPGINIMIGLNQMGASLSEVWPDLLNLTLLTLVYGAVAFFRYCGPSPHSRHQTSNQKSATT